MPEFQKLDDAQAIIEAARESSGVSPVMPRDGREFIVHSDRAEIREITSPSWLPPAPARIRAHVRADHKASFTEYLAAFADISADPSGGWIGKPIIFADIKLATMTGVLDYHGRGAPTNCDHKATLKLQYSEEWARWSAMSGKLVPQAEFARFLEENAADVLAPSGADLLEICRDMSATKKVDFRQAVNLSNGDVRFEFDEQTEATSKSRAEPLQVPKLFKLAIPVYFGERPTEISAFLRYEPTAGGLKLGIELHRPEFVKQAAFQLIGVEIREATGVPVIYGAERA
jgi:uncharacterized protein YfdQ (DUF2303 family)